MATFVLPRSSLPKMAEKLRKKFWWMFQIHFACIRTNFLKKTKMTKFDNPRLNFTPNSTF